MKNHLSMEESMGAGARLDAYWKKYQGQLLQSILDKCHVAADGNEKAYSRDILDDGIIRRDLESRAFDSHIGTKVQKINKVDCQHIISITSIKHLSQW